MFTSFWVCLGEFLFCSLIFSLSVEVGELQLRYTELLMRDEAEGHGDVTVNSLFIHLHKLAFTTLLSLTHELFTRGTRRLEVVVILACSSSSPSELLEFDRFL